MGKTTKDENLHLGDEQKDENLHHGDVRAQKMKTFILGNLSKHYLKKNYEISSIG